MSAFTVLWRALFLACSWTWCIGMFLPIFLIDDFGVWGWVAFALPNVVGAAAVGLIVATPQRSRAIVERQAHAMRLFSAVTIAFHLFFLGQILRVMNPSGETVGAFWASPVLVLLIGAAAALLATMRTRGWMIASVVAFALSILAGVLMCVMSDGQAYEPAPAIGQFGIGDLLWATPALCFGFLLCPHLDLTFHRTRQEAPGRIGDGAFVIGFCLFFLSLIVFTLMYASSFLDRAWINYWIALHFGAQSAFTMGAHWRELRVQRAAAPSLGVLAAGAALGLLWPVNDFRLGYDLILYAYAIPFPAYVWIVMIPRSISRGRAHAAWLVSVILATPIFAYGFLGAHWWAIPIGIAIPLLAPLAAARLVRSEG